MRTTKSGYGKYLLLLCWIFLIILFSLLDYDYMPTFVKDTIKFKQGYGVHFASYFLSSFLIWIAFTGNLSKIIGWNLILFCLSVGLEFSQLYVPSRAFNLTDILMNFSGILCFNLLPAGVYGWKKAWRLK